ncbi:C-reactive protein-like [Trematomus bernacchii]|uniref:C-reactive protein-like n=1 Tax=Trematomus bernacchii TaxID=40690 RepID=UPI00146C87C0|nr:C-reactive protein-like [Trematomus bernacchii]
MEFVLLLLMVTACAAITQGKQHSLCETDTKKSGFRSYNCLSQPTADGILIYVHNKPETLGGEDYKVNTWHSICSTWDSVTGVAQLWLDNKPFIRKYVGGARIRNPVIIIGQEQDSHGGGFDKTQSFVGMISDVHMWDYTFSACEIQEYMLDRNLTPGNVLNWKALDYRTYGRVLTEQKTTCSCTE